VRQDVGLGRLGDVGHDPPVDQEEDAVGARGGAGVVGDHDGGLAVEVDGVAQQVEDQRARVGVEVAGRLVGEQHGGLGDERPGDRHALLLAAGQLGRAVATALGEVDALEQRVERLALHLASLVPTLNAEEERPAALTIAG
jgi:hypothetical protein